VLIHVSSQRGLASRDSNWVRRLLDRRHGGWAVGVALLGCGLELVILCVPIEKNRGLLVYVNIAYAYDTIHARFMCCLCL
jgi:hypothetical protein